MRILAVGAHPDDVEIGCGGFLIRAAKKGHEVYMLVLTLGEASIGSNDDREGEARRSAKAIGARKIWFGGFRDTELTTNGKLVNAIEDVVKKIKPDIVFTHCVNDEHHDHQATGDSTIEAARYVPNIFAYENPLTKEFVPKVFVDITEVIKQKVNLLSFFLSQKDKIYLKKEAIFGLAQYRALQSRLENVRFVEAYELVKLSFVGKDCDKCVFGLV